MKIYTNGTELINDNLEFLNENKYLSVFFRLDAPLITKVDKINYVAKWSKGKNKLLVMKVEPYNMLLYGDKTCVKDCIKYLIKNDYEIKGILCAADVGEEVVKVMKEYGITYYTALKIDFMEAKEITAPASKEVRQADLTNVDELFECLDCFTKDCGLIDKVNKDNIAKNINDYYFVKKDDKIASMAKISLSSDNDLRISCVYTRPEYRGQGLARKVVNTLKNLIIEQGKIATLNVDQNNSISNHLYSSLGFTKVFSQAEYRRM